MNTDLSFDGEQPVQLTRKFRSEMFAPRFVSRVIYPTEPLWTESPEIKQGTKSPGYRLRSKVIDVLVAVLTNDHSSKCLFQKCVAAKTMH